MRYGTVPHPSRHDGKPKSSTHVTLEHLQCSTQFLLRWILGSTILTSTWTKFNIQIRHHHQITIFNYPSQSKPFLYSSWIVFLQQLLDQKAGCWCSCALVSTLSFEQCTFAGVVGGGEGNNIHFRPPVDHISRRSCRSNHHKTTALDSRRLCCFFFEAKGRDDEGSSDAKLDGTTFYFKLSFFCFLSF